MKPIEFSKIILYVSWAWMAVVSIFSMVMVALGRESSTLDVLITSSAAEVTAATGFYYWKAKAENKIKLCKHYGPEIYEASGVKED